MYQSGKLIRQMKITKDKGLLTNSGFLVEAALKYEEILKLAPEASDAWRGLVIGLGMGANGTFAPSGGL